ncbi:MAG: hypothetical protein AB8G16_03500, partial [Gammaproteobacteria bacterium]
ATDGNAAASTALAKILHRHGLRRQEKVDMTSADLPRIIGDLMQWSRRHLQPPKQLNLLDSVAHTTYSEQRISDDRAYVMATCKGRCSETRLKRQDGRWYLL